MIFTSIGILLLIFEGFTALFPSFRRIRVIAMDKESSLHNKYLIFEIMYLAWVVFGFFYCTHVTGLVMIIILSIFSAMVGEKERIRLLYLDGALSFMFILYTILCCLPN